MKKQERNGKLFAAGQAFGKLSITALGVAVISFVAGTACNLIIDGSERKEAKNRQQQRRK